MRFLCCFSNYIMFSGSLLLLQTYSSYNNSDLSSVIEKEWSFMVCSANPFVCDLQQRVLALLGSIFVQHKPHINAQVLTRFKWFCNVSKSPPDWDKLGWLAGSAQPSMLWHLHSHLYNKFIVWEMTLHCACLICCFLPSSFRSFQIFLKCFLSIPHCSGMVIVRAKYGFWFMRTHHWFKHFVR